MHRELADDSLAGPGRRAHQNTVAAFQGRTRLLLKAVESKWQFRSEPRQFAHDVAFSAAPPHRFALHRRSAVFR
jgi:hypothetical protein